MKKGFQRVLFIFLLLVFLLSMLPFALGDVIINEFLPDGAIEPDSEWVELFNNGSSAVSLDKWNITEKGASANFTLNLSIPANGFVILVNNFTLFNSTYPNLNSSGLISDYGEIVASFQLANSNGFLDLYNSSGEKVSNISYSSTTANNSIGRHPDGTSNIIEFTIPTPGAKNDNVTPAFNKWVNPSLNNSQVSVSLNITVNITDAASTVNTSLVDFNGTNFSMTKSGEIWHFLWNISTNLDKVYNITIYFNDSNGFSSSDTIFNITAGNKPVFNRWANPGENNSFVGGLLNITANITDVTSVSSALVNFNNSNFSMSQNNDLWYFLWNTTLNVDGKYNITIFFNDTFGFSNTDTLSNLTVDNTKPKISTPATTANSRNFINPGFVFNASANSTDANLLNVTCSLSGTTVGNFSVNGDIHKCNLTAPITENIFVITLTAIDKAGNTNTTTVNFTTKYSTTATLAPQDITVSGLNQSNKVVEVNATLTNTGSSEMFDTGAILSGFSSSVLSATSLTYKSCSLNINNSQSCNVTFNITVKGGSSGAHTIFWNANWTNNNFTVNDFSQAVTSTVTLSSNPEISVAKNTSANIAHGQNTTLALDLNSTGNANLEDVNITFIPGTLQSSFVTLQPGSFNLIGAGTNKTFNVTINIPEHHNPGNYTGTLNITSSSISHKTISLRVEVPTDSSWTSSPKTLKSFKKDNFAGLLGDITINNTGNIGQNYSISYIGDLFFFIWNQTSADNKVFTQNAHIYVERNQTKDFSMFHKADGPLTSFNLSITITSTNTSATNVSTANLTRDNTSPTVNITDPLNNSFVKNIVDFNVTSTDINLSRVEYYINSQLVLNDTGIEFTFDWNTTNGTYPDNVYKLEAISYDTAGNFNSSNINVTVNNTDDDPILLGNIPTINIVEDNDSTIVNLSLFFKTLDGDSLTYNFTQPDNVTVQVNNATQIANFSPSGNFSGTNYIILTAIDSSQNTTSSNNITITVSNVNDAPAIPALSSPLNNTNLKSATGQVNLVWNASLEADGDTVSYFVFFSNNSLNVSLNTTPVNATTTATSLQLNGLENGTYFWNLIAGDGSLNASRTSTFQFTLNSDEKPNVTFWQWNNTLLDSSSSSAIVNRSIAVPENKTVSFKILAADPDNDALTFNWYLNNSQKSSLQNFTFNFTNNFTSKGFYNITLIVMDNNSNEDRETWNLTVNNLNRVSTITQIPNQAIIEETLNTTINLSAFFTELDLDDTLTFFVVSQNTSQVTCSIRENNVTLKGSSNFAGNGSSAASCTIIASDGLLNSTNNTFSINVSNTPDAPVLISIGTLTAVEETLFYYDVNATDPENQVLAFSDNSTLFNISSTSGNFTLNATNAQVGTHKINITVNDTGGLQDSEIITLTITNSNDNPVLDQISNKDATEDSTIRFNVTAIDIDGDSLTFSANLTGFAFTNAANNSQATVVFTPTNSNVGNNTVNITVTDGALTSSQKFLLSVNNTNDAPTISGFFPVQNKTIAENIGSQLFNVTAVDVDAGDSLTIAWSRNGTIVNSNSTNVTITGLNQGIYNITAIANDTSGVSARNEWTLTVASQITSSLYTSPATDGLNSSQLENVTSVVINRVNVGSINFGNSALNFSGITVLEDAINISNGTVSVDTSNFPGLNRTATIVMQGLPFPKAPVILVNESFNSVSGNATCSLTRCTNRTYDKVNGILTFNVQNFSTYFVGTNVTNGVPLITSTPITTAVEGSQYSYDVDASDNDGDTLTFSLTASPSGMSISSSSGLITWTPSSSQLGVFNVTVNVTDGSLSDGQSFNITASKGAKLIISDLDVKVDSKSSKNVQNNTKISKEAEPGFDIEFKIEIENRFTDDENLDINDIEVQVTIEDIDDGDDIEEEADDFDLDQGDDKTIKVSFDIPLLVEEGTYDVIIDVEAEDENGTQHDIKWELELEVEKEKHDLRLRKLSLNPTTVSCSRTATLSTQIVNLGRDDEDEVTLEILNSQLGVNFRKEDIELEEGDDADDVTYSKTLTIRVPENQEPGIYPITVNAYHDNDDLDESETIDLTVQDCERLKTVKDPVVKKVSEPVEIVRPPSVTQEKPPVTQITFKESDSYVVLLAVTFILLTGLIIFAAGAAFILLRKR